MHEDGLAARREVGAIVFRERRAGHQQVVGRLAAERLGQPFHGVVVEARVVA